MPIPNDPRYTLLTRSEAAEVLRMPPAYLAHLKRKRRGPRCCKFGTADRSPCRYRLSDLLAWVEDPAGHERQTWGVQPATKRTRRK